MVVFFIAMTKQLLDRTDVIASLQEVGGLTWPKSSVAGLPGMAAVVGAGRFVDTGHQHRSLYSFLKQAQTQMVPALLARRQAVAINC